MIISSESELIELGRKFGASLKGGEVIELVGDVGVGKTTFTKGLAQGLGITNTINSPSFMIMKSYLSPGGITLNHYDFYRLDDAGIMKSQIAESIGDSKAITVVEWAKGVTGILPKNRQIIEIKYLPNSEGREVTMGHPAHSATQNVAGSRKGDL